MAAEEQLERRCLQSSSLYLCVLLLWWFSVSSIWELLVRGLLRGWAERGLKCLDVAIKRNGAARQLKLEEEELRGN